MVVIRGVIPFVLFLILACPSWGAAQTSGTDVNPFLQRFEKIQQTFEDKVERRACSNQAGLLSDRLREVCCALTNGCVDPVDPSPPGEIGCDAAKLQCKLFTKAHAVAEAAYGKLQRKLEAAQAKIRAIYERIAQKVARLEADLSDLSAKYEQIQAQCLSTDTTIDERTRRSTCREAARVERQVEALRKRIERVKKLADDAAQALDESVAFIENALDAANLVVIATADEQELSCARADLVCSGLVPGATPTPTVTPTPTALPGKCYIRLQPPAIGRLIPPPITPEVSCADCANLVEPPSLPTYPLIPIGNRLVGPPKPYPACQIVR